MEILPSSPFPAVVDCQQGQQHRAELQERCSHWGWCLIIKEMALKGHCHRAEIQAVKQISLPAWPRFFSDSAFLIKQKHYKEIKWLHFLFPYVVWVNRWELVLVKLTKIQCFILLSLKQKSKCRLMSKKRKMQKLRGNWSVWLSVVFVASPIKLFWFSEHFCGSITKGLSCGCGAAGPDVGYTSTQRKSLPPNSALHKQRTEHR